jgi:hypothetical protein
MSRLCNFDQSSPISVTSKVNKNEHTHDIVQYESKKYGKSWKSAPTVKLYKQFKDLIYF